MIIQLSQLQEHRTFQFPLEIGLVKDGVTTIETIQMDERSKSFKIKSKDQPDSIVLDPNQWTLFEDMGKL